MVRVTWRDAWFDMEGESEHDDYLCNTVGWLLDEGPDWVVVAGEMTPDGPRAVTHIPRPIVQDISYLEGS